MFLQQAVNLDHVFLQQEVNLDHVFLKQEVNSLYRFDEGDIPRDKSARQCLDEFDNFIVKRENFNAYFGSHSNSKIIILTI